ncbi:LysR substrate-binding domain-containing protein [Pseudoalteromonas sp. SCSIO 43210]
MSKLPPLKSLQYFEAAARHLNFSQAANELCVTHSAVSHQIKKLERWAGTSLFVRVAKGVELSSLGERLMQDCQESFAILELFATEIRPQGIKDVLILGSSSSFQANWLLHKIAEFERFNPSIKVKFTTQYQISDLVKKKVDCLIHSDDKTYKGIHSVKLFSDRIGPVHSPDMKVIAKTPEQFQNKKLISAQSRPEAWKTWADKVGCSYSKLHFFKEVDSLSLMLVAAKASLGIAIAPQMLISEELKRGELIAPFGFIDSAASFMYSFLPNSSKKQSLIKLQDWLIKTANVHDQV